MIKKSAKATSKKGGSSKRRAGAGRPSSRTALARKAGSGKDSFDKELPSWAHVLLAVCSSLLILLSAYYILIRPYSYRWKPCYGSKAYDVCMPSGFQVYGIDVSHHQGSIDWNKVAMSSDAEYPIRFALMKATEGGDFLDENFEVNFSGAQTAGLVCGAYLFYNPFSSPETQASFYINNVSLGKDCLPPVVDIENKGESRDVLQADLLKCIEILEKHYGVKPIIYTSYKFRKHYLNNPAFDRYRLWIAQYRIEKPENDMDWSIWQFTDRGHLEGIRGNVDLNVFRDSQKSFSSFLMK